MSPEEFDMDPSKGSREKRHNRGFGVNYELTEHAREGLQNRPNIRIEWIERILGCPELIEPFGAPAGPDRGLWRARVARDRPKKYHSTAIDYVLF